MTTSQLRQSAALSGVRDVGSIEIDVILTHLLQLFHEHGLTEHLAFKGGTFLRKMVFGPRGRLATAFFSGLRANRIAKIQSPAEPIPAEEEHEFISAKTAANGSASRFVPSINMCSRDCFPATNSENIAYFGRKQLLDALGAGRMAQRSAILR
jgi:hypothetical protein